MQVCYKSEHVFLRSTQRVLKCPTGSAKVFSLNVLRWRATNFVSVEISKPETLSGTVAAEDFGKCFDNIRCIGPEPVPVDVEALQDPARFRFSSDDPVPGPASLSDTSEQRRRRKVWEDLHQDLLRQVENWTDDIIGGHSWKDCVFTSVHFNCFMAYTELVGPLGNTAPVMEWTITVTTSGTDLTVSAFL